MSVYVCMHMCVCMYICVQYLQHKMMVTMSEQALVDCSWGYGNNGCDGGETFKSYEWIMDNGCIPTEDSYGMYLQQVRLSVFYKVLLHTK